MGTRLPKLRRLYPPDPLHHALAIAAAIELRAAFAQPQNRSRAGSEGNHGGLLVDLDVLNLFALGSRDGESQWVGRERHPQIPKLHGLGPRRTAEFNCRRSER